MIRKHRRRGLRRALLPALLYLLLCAGAAPMLVPFAWMLSTSLKPRELAAEPNWLPRAERAWLLRPDGGREEVLPLVHGRDGRVKVRRADGETVFVPEARLRIERRIEPQWENYARLLRFGGSRSGDDDFARYFLNTLLVAGMSVLGQVLSSALVGWGFARLRFVGREVLFMLMLATLMIPGQIGMIPVFMIFRALGWIDTFLPLIVPAWLGNAFFAFLYRQFFMSLPVELDEAARVDGASPLVIFWAVLLPLARPVTVTVAVFSFLGAWNDFLGPLIYLNSDHKRTLSLALAKFQGAYATDVPALMAAATLMLLPVLAIYLFSQRFLVRGMAMSGIKG